MSRMTGNERITNDSVVEEQKVRTTGGWNQTKDWVRSFYNVILVGALLVGVLLAARFLFMLASANATNGFIDFIYDISKPFAQPFQGIFTDTGNAEWAAILGIVVYTGAAFLLIAVLTAITSSGPKSDGEKTTTSRTERDAEWLNAKR